MTRVVYPNREIEWAAMQRGHVCGSCKYFAEFKSRPGIGICNLISQSTDESREAMSRYAFIVNADNASLEVRDLFGCILWESKEAAV